MFLLVLFFQEYISSVLPRTAFYLEWSDKNIISINNTSSIFTSEPNAKERANFFNHWSMSRSKLCSIKNEYL